MNKGSGLLSGLCGSVALFILGCAGTNSIDEIFGPDGRTLRTILAAAPPERQEDFATLQNRCVKCHRLSKAFAAHVPTGGWELVVGKMARKPGAGIPREEASRISGFLEWYHSAR